MKRAFVATWVAVVVLALVALVGIAYLVLPAPPYGFYYDLGVDVLATSAISHWIHGLTDLKDAIGWAGWGDRPAFAFAPMTSVAITVLLAKAFEWHAFEAVKCVQVIEVLLAAACAFALYRVLRPGSGWAWVAAAIYALLPEPLLMIRGNVAFGFTAAFAPLAPAAALVLVRRYRLWALPLCAAIAALLSAYFAVEHLFLQAIPAYALAVALAYDRERRAAWALAALAGLAILFASVAYVVLPTQASMALFSPTATVGAALGGGEFARYSNGPLALASLCITEFIVNGRKEFVLGPLLFLTVPIGLSLWALAVAWVVGACKRGAFAWGERRLGMLGLICVLLSTGSLIPGVGVIWWIVSQIPVLDNIRTPDRFIALGVAVVVVFAVSELEWLSTQRSYARFAAALGAVLPVAGFTLFLLLRVLLGDTSSVDAKEPYLGVITAAAQARGNRVADLALTDEGSVFDTPLYGAPLPSLAFQNDFAERYEADGLGGAGLLARGNVATIVASPPWTPDSPLLGQSSLARASMLRPVAGDATTVSAYAVQPIRGYVHAVSGACIWGGPGLLDNLVALPAFTDTAFLFGAPSCRRTLYADAPPQDASAGGEIVYRWTATQLFPHSGLMRDIDYRVSFGRFFINNPWYRNAIDGDSPAFSPAAVSLDSGDRASSVFEIARPGNYVFSLHVVCHGEALGHVTVDRSTHRFVCPPASGFQWLSVPLGPLGPGLHGMTLSFDRIAVSSAVWGTTWRLAFDGAGIAVRRPVGIATPAAFAFSADRFQVSSLPPAAGGRLSFAGASGMLPLASGAPNAPMLLARIPNAIASYRFEGAPGRYRILAAAYTESGYQAANYVAFYTGKTCCSAVSTSAQSRGAVLLAYGDVNLHDGELVHVLVHTAANDAASIVQLFGVIAQPDPLPALPGEGRSRVSADFDFLDRLHHLAPEVPLSAAPVPGRNAIEPLYGLPLDAALTLRVRFPARTSSSPTTLHLLADYGNGVALARLACGSKAVTGTFSSPRDTLVLPPATSHSCTVTLASRWSTLFVQDVQVARSIRSYDLRARRWIAAGTYRPSLIRRGGAPAGGSLFVDGRAAGTVVGVARSGWHLLSWHDAPPDAYVVALVPAAWPRDAEAPGVRQIASGRWEVRLRRRTTLEAAVFPDGYWRLAGKSRSYAGGPCDLENTCFARVPAGSYVLLHVWPAYVKLGLAVTLLAWLAALAAYLYARRRQPA